LSENIAWELGFESLEARAASRALSDDGLEVGSGSGTTVDCTRDAALGNSFDRGACCRGSLVMDLEMMCPHVRGSWEGAFYGLDGRVWRCCLGA
jgi:hypothetical protein